MLVPASYVGPICNGSNTDRVCILTSYITTTTMLLVTSYKAKLSSSKDKTKVLYQILGDDRLSEKQKRELADYMQLISRDRMTSVYKKFKR
ncbi:MAG: hypothetical protein JNN12_16425 [Bacteroidetes Order II. Incertae sedis bacterium]|nr:hypothetical protein [Bacteroidetes Order II. bacterium]